MKHFLLLIFTFSVSYLSAQMRIPVSYYKNVNLIFNNNIINDDISSDKLNLAHDANILKIGAKQPFDFETSITVLTEDNIFFTFLIVYDEKLDKLTYIIPDSVGVKIPYTKKNPKEIVETNSGELNTDYLDRICENVYSANHIFSEIGYTYKKISVELAGIWVKDDVLFFKLLMANNSNISYDISSTNLYVKERTRVRKSTTEPIEKEPIYTYGTPVIPAKSVDNIYIMVFEKFTISHDKKLVLEVVEKNGGRKIEFEIVKDLIIRAPVIN